MKFGIIGAGMIGHFHAKAITAMSGGTLHSVFDLRAEAAERLAGEYGAKAYTDIDQFLADPELEIVTIGTPSGAHLEPALAALNAGKHVICEKPLEITVARVDQLMAAAAANGKTLAAVLNRRFHPGMDAFKKAATEGRFGRLTSASAYVKWYRDQAYYDSAAWRGTWALDGGGALMNQSIHTVDALIHLAGPVRSVQANAACLAHTGIEVEDIVVAILEFENGARGVIEATTCTWSKDGHPARVQLSGTEGSVFLADEAFEIWDFKDEKPEDAEIRATLMRGQEAGLGANDPSAINFYQHQRNFEEVVNAIREGREPSTSAAEARKPVELITAIYQSAHEGGKKIVLIP
jgi:UDP-N-acetyl-2-amino-2-deoxyglucuronate dehydrogenase